MTDLTTVSFSELDAFYACPLRWRLQYKERWNIDRAVPALDRGTVWHAMLQTHYELGRRGCPLGDRAIPVKKCMMSGGLDADENDLLWWMYEGYVACYDRDPEHEVLATEINRVVPLPDPADPSRPGQFALKVKIDQVTRNVRTGQLWVWDHKSGKDFASPERMQWRPQFPLYAWALKVAQFPVWGVIVNAARTTRNKSPMTFEQRFRRNYLLYSDRQLNAFALEAAKAAAAMHDPNRIEYASPRDLAMGACSICDYEDAHRQFMRGVEEETALTDLGFIRGYDRPELIVTKPV